MSKSEKIEALTVDRLRAALRDDPSHPPLVIVLPGYEPRGTAGRVYEVTQAYQTTVAITPRGGGRSLKVSPYSLAMATETDVQAHDSRYTPPVGEVHLGSVVRLNGEKWEAGTLWVVIQLGATTVNVARLCGDEGRYWRKVLMEKIAEVVAASDLAEAVMRDPGLG